MASQQYTINTQRKEHNLNQGRDITLYASVWKPEKKERSQESKSSYHTVTVLVKKSMNKIHKCLPNISYYHQVGSKAVCLLTQSFEMLKYTIHLLQSKHYSFNLERNYPWRNKDIMSEGIILAIGNNSEKKLLSLYNSSISCFLKKMGNIKITKSLWCLSGSVP